MSSDRRIFDRLRVQAQQAREIGDYRQAARLERQAAEWAGARGLAGSQARALLWEGYSLRQAGEDDLALAALLQAAHDRATTDPADVFSALTAILHISLERKPFRFCRTLMDQTRDWLFELRRPWNAPLDFLEGELAFRRGEFATAWDWHQRAWAGWRDEHPRLTPATHLWALCRTAFWLGDPAILEQEVGKLAELHPTQRLERELVQRAQLLLWRVQPTESDPVDLALALLTSSINTGETRDSGAYREALLTLALVGRWREMDDALAQRPLKNDCFEEQLILADLELNRLRMALDLPTSDDDGNAAAINAVQINVAQSVSLGVLDQIEQDYKLAQSLADEQDQRLETDWYGARVRRRWKQLTLLARR
ncbi:MAG: hypothetical protein KDJ22_05680 [Candidatus Competibacteraceae bacterium]|nr:hypothetical protein [Candidatus Competibacteraceae bacterium]MCP5124151.1 hypothetical protein [Gammaproteobacteria bacterium]HRX72308.1 hypothetical protein [Candidatus Competibacteraceae bacterium]